MFKPAGKTDVGDNLVECPVCQNLYLPAGITNHLSQTAGKEAQYEMARLVYNAIDEVSPYEPDLGVVWQSVGEILENCPHWKYLLENKEEVNIRPVEKKHRRSDWFTKLQEFLHKK